MLSNERFPPNIDAEVVTVVGFWPNEMLLNTLVTLDVGEQIGFPKNVLALVAAGEVKDEGAEGVPNAEVVGELPKKVDDGKAAAAAPNTEALVVVAPKVAGVPNIETVVVFVVGLPKTETEVVEKMDEVVVAELPPKEGVVP